jgi:Protein of unknown function (DUF3618)
MSQESRPMAAPAGNGEVAGTEELRAEIEQTRRDLGDTVEALAAKADVKARAKEASDRMRADMSARGQRMAKDMSVRGRRMAKSAREAPKTPMIAVGATGLAVAGAVVVLRVRSRRSGTPMWIPPKMPRQMAGKMAGRKARRMAGGMPQRMAGRMTGRSSRQKKSWERIAARYGR